VIVDAEADPALNFGALADAQRFARIDLGHRISIEWEQIRRQSAERMKDINKPVSDPADHFMHFAVGKIQYADGIDGVLVYIKANMTGDEADYIKDYERRYPTFPHETTADQLFSEEQTEAYRALGFHSVSHAFANESGFLDIETATLVEEARKLLGITLPGL